MAHLGAGAFDIDGTLLHHKQKPDYLSPASLALAMPDIAICARVRNLIELGMDIHFITGRSKEVSETTLDQLRAFVHPNILPSRLHMQDAFTGYRTMAAWKANKLREVKANWFVGDHLADEEAAFEAEIPFQYAETYRETSKAAPWAVV